MGIHILFDEFDKDDNGEIDFQEFMVMADYFKTAMSLTVGTKSGSDNDSDSDDDDDDINYEFQYDPSTGGLKKVYGLTQHQSIIDRNQERNNNNMAALLSSSIHESKKDHDSIVRNIAKDLYPMRDILCLQNDVRSFGGDATDCLDYDQLFEDDKEKVQSQLNPSDHEFESAFP